MHRKRHLRVGAVDRARRREYEMPAAVAAAFEDVVKAGQVGIHIGKRIVQRIAHAGLRGEVHDRSEVAVAK